MPVSAGRRRAGLRLQGWLLVVDILQYPDDAFGRVSVPAFGQRAGFPLSEPECLQRFRQSIGVVAHYDIGALGHRFRVFHVII